MPTAAAARKKKGGTPSASDAEVAAPARTQGRGVRSAATALPFGRGVGLAPPPRSLGRGGGPVAAATPPGTSSSTPMDGFPFPPALDGSYGGCFPNSSSWLDAAGGDASSPGSWVNPSGGFMSYFNSLPNNSHLVGAMNPLPCINVDASPQEVENVLGNDNDPVRTEKRIMWTEDEDVSLMSAWIKHSTDSTCGADKSGGQYWDEVVETYNKTTFPLRRRSVKQCKDRLVRIS